MRESLDYQAFYCEENVWRLLARPEFADEPTWAVIVCNVPRDLTLMRQLAGRPIDGLIHWDYHVFAVVTDPIAGKLTLDLDSELPFPCELPRYLEETFPSDVQRAYAPRFRLLDGKEYVSDLVSDRSHMKRADGSWMALPPPWSAPGAESGRPSLLMSWIDADRRSPGALYDTFRMAAFAACPGR